MLNAALLAVLSVSIGYSIYLQNDLWEARERLKAYEDLQVRATNPWWVEEQQLENARNPVELSANDSITGMKQNWTEYLDRHTPVAWQEKNISSGVDCTNMADVVIGQNEFGVGDYIEKARLALTECGFVYLDNLFPKEVVNDFSAAFKQFTNTSEAQKFRYPCQGKGRVEHMIPFRPPFNDTTIYGNKHLLAIIQAFLNAQFKLELMTVIDSPPNSGNQRWHQGWQYLFHEEERLPPYSLVATLPLDDVSLEMGPTEFCVGKKLRLYHGWRCPDELLVSASLSLGSMALFDYKTLHRGPANKSKKSRPMISMVFSNKFFVNSNAFVNRGITFLQTLHQRMYWEQFFWHPSGQTEFFAV